MSSRSILKNTAVVAVLTALSRVLGLVREMLQSRLVGADVEQSAFAVAFAIPNMARRMFGEGALTAAFVPVFKGELEADASLVKARRLARAVMTMSLLMLAAGVILAWCLIGGAFWYDSDGTLLAGKWGLTLYYVRILIPYMLFICAAAFGMGVLNSFGKFAAAALMPSILNVVWIVSLVGLFFATGHGTDAAFTVHRRVVFICVAILGAGFLQMAFMLRAMAKKGISPWPSFKGWRDANVRLVWRNMAIGCAGAGAVQINYMLDQVLALKASDWAAGAIGYADRLMELPLGIVGTAFGTVLLPTFSGFFARADVDGARSAFVSSVRNMLLVVLPAAAALVVLAPELTRLVYHGGRFDDAATVRVARAVACYSVGLAFFCLQKTLTPWFQAQKDLNCSGISCVWLALIARRRNGSLGWRRLFRPIALMLGASAAMAAALLVLRHVLAAVTAWGTMGEILSMAAYVAGGMVVYFAVMGVLGRDVLRGLLRDFRNRGGRA